MSKRWKVTLSNTLTVKAKTKEEAIEKAKFHFNYWHEDGYNWLWNKELAREIKEGEKE